MTAGPPSPKMVPASRSPSSVVNLTLFTVYEGVAVGGTKVFVGWGVSGCVGRGVCVGGRSVVVAVWGKEVSDAREDKAAGLEQPSITATQIINRIDFLCIYTFILLTFL
jgi:hypothetical protein